MATWLDAHGSSRATDVYATSDVPHKSALVKTYGILVKHDAEGLSLASEAFPDSGEVRGYTFIPLGMLQTVEPLQPRKSRTRAVQESV